MWDDIIAEMLEAGEDVTATQVRTDAAGVTRTVKYGVAPTGSLTSDDKSAWADAAEQGIKWQEERKLSDDKDKSKDKDSRERTKVLTGKTARKFAERINGITKAPAKQKGKRDGKPDTVEPSTNGQH